MELLQGVPVMLFESQAAWEEWLGSNHPQTEGLWLKIAKKASGHSSVSYDEAVDSSLCYGWIDGQKKAYDDKFWLQKLTPRRARSIWSKVNTERVARLITANRMQPAGLAQVEAAKADGRWDAAYHSQSTMEMPEDFVAALEANPAAKEFFEALSASNRYSIYFRINSLKRPANRAARIEQFVAALSRGEKPLPLL